MSVEQMTAAEYVAQQATEKRSPKYGNRKTTVDGYTFDSAAEAKRYGELRLMEQAGLVFDLQLHPRFALMVNGEMVGGYSADFQYMDQEGKLVVEDVKGGNATKTEAYRLRKRLMKAIHGITIREVGR